MHIETNGPLKFRLALLAATMLLTQFASAANAGPAKATIAAPAIATGKAHPATAGNTVTIQNFAFQPATLTVAAGSEVVWVNRDEEPHALVSTDAQFKPSGTYAYFCSIHPHMVGKIIVK
jgi:plastocyanin